jgi:hypothetical protein
MATIEHRTDVDETSTASAPRSWHSSLFMAFKSVHGIQARSWHSSPFMDARVAEY